MLERVAPSVRLCVKALIHDAIAQRASDLHFNPGADAMRTFIRVDGQLHPFKTLEQSLTQPLLICLKVLLQMDLESTRIPQSGQAVFHDSLGLSVRIRGSLLPGLDDESIALRLIHENLRVSELTELGMPRAQVSQITQGLLSQAGMTLIVGPTGAGKSTTLRACMQHLSAQGLKVLSIEDPVEGVVPDTTPMELNPKQGLDFQAALSAILRQTPDVIAIGEMRDAESLQVAFQAALTGHRVLSTLHARDCLYSFPRLIHLGLKPDVIAAALRGVIAQRLLPLNCPHCKQARALTQEDRDRLHLSQKWNPKEPVQGKAGSLYSGLEQIWEGIGCDSCQQHGTLGRTGIFEVLELDSGWRDQLSQAPSLKSLHDYAQAHPFKTLSEQAYDCVCDGRCSPARGLAYG